MTITVLKLSDADAYLKNISIKTIKDVRALDVDLLLVLVNGDRIIINNGAVNALSSPDSSLQFADGKLPFSTMFQQIEKIDVSPEANLTVSSKEITRYNQNNAKNKKARKEEEEDGDKPVVVEPGEREPSAATESHGNSGNTEQPNFTPTKAPDHQSQIADAEINSQHDKNWGVQWPLAAGALALLAAAGGGGGGGGGGSSGNSGNSGGGSNISNAGSAANGGNNSAGTGTGPAAAGGGGGAGTIDPSAAVVRGSATLGTIKNANVTAYDQFGNALSDTVAVVDGKYTLTLNRPLYKGPLLLVVRDNTPGVADNYVDEASLKLTDLGTIPLRAVVMASGVNQTINVTALTELAALKAGLDQGVLRLADLPEVTEERITAANNAVSGFFKVDAIGGEVVATTEKSFNNALSVETQNYGAALKAIANLVRLDSKTYPNQAVVLARLADNLKFLDDAGTGLKWATNTAGQTLPRASALQGALFSEALIQIMDNPELDQEARELAQRTYDALQKLPNGSTVADYLANNHVAIPNPVITIRNAVISNPKQWQDAPTNTPLVLDQGDFFDGNMRVKTTPNAKVSVMLKAIDGLGREVSITLPTTRADASGNAIIMADDNNREELFNLDSSRSITAQVTVIDGNNSRTNHALWSSNSTDVRVNLNTPANMTRFAAQDPLSLASDTFYNDTNDRGSFPATNGDRDRLTRNGAIRIALNKQLDDASEQLQLAIATSFDDKGNPIWDIWREVPTKLNTSGSNPNRFVYETDKLTEANGEIWVKARVVQKGSQFTGGYGNANTLETPLRFTFDNVAPPALNLRLAAGRDDGVLSNDGITRQTGSALELSSPRADGAELHFQLQAGAGTDNTSLVIVNADGIRTKVATGTWYTLKASEQLVLQGDTKEGNGKVVLKLRHIDAAGNYNEITQTFITDTTGTIEQVSLLIQRNTARLEAHEAVLKAQAEFTAARVSEQAAKQAVLAAAQRAEIAAKSAYEQSIVDVRKTLRTALSDGTMRLDIVLGHDIEDEYLPAIVNQLSLETKTDRINYQAGLNEFVQRAMGKADAAVKKTSEYGDAETKPAPTREDFFDMGILGLDTDVARAAVVDALKELPLAKSNSITKIQNVTNAYNKVLALANGKTDTAKEDLPTAEDYLTLGVISALSPAGATILGNVLDGKRADEVDTIAKLATIAGSAQRIAQQAAGSKPDRELSFQDFDNLDISGVTADNLADIVADLTKVPDILKSRGKVSGLVDSLDEIKAIVELNIGQLQVLIRYAKGETPINPEAPQQVAPTLQNYENKETAGNNAVTAANLGAINSAIKEVGASNMDSWKKVAALVGSYNRILKAADGIAGNNRTDLPTLEDYQRIGVAKSLQEVFTKDKMVDTDGRSSALALLNEVVDASQRNMVDTVAQLRTLVDVAARAVRLAQDGQTSLSAADFKLLVPSSTYTEEQMDIVRSGISGTADDGSQVNSRSKLADVGQKAVVASNKIRAYADDASRPAPDQDDYQDLGIVGINTPLRASALNSALATDQINGSKVARPKDLQDIAQAYLRILGEAGDNANAAPDPSTADYVLIGAVAPSRDNVTDLINSALHGKTVNDVATVTQVSTLVRAANAIHALAKGQGVDLAQDEPSAQQLDEIKAQLLLLGLTEPASGTLQAIIAAIGLSPADGSAIADFAKLKQLSDAAQAAQQKINTYADAADGASPPVPTVADYRAMGVDKISTNTELAAINSSLASPTVQKAQTASPRLVQSIVGAYQRIFEVADGAPGKVGGSDTSSADKLPTINDYRLIGLDADLLAPLGGTSSLVLAMLNTQVDAAIKDKVNTVSLLNEQARIAGKIIEQLRGDISDSKLTLDELSKAGIRGLDAKTFPAVLSALAASANDGSAIIGQVNGTLKLQTLADNADRAQRELENYADNQSTAKIPSTNTYLHIGLDLRELMPLAGSPGNALKAINSALNTSSIKSAQVNPPAELKKIIDAYNVVLKAADGLAPADDTISNDASNITVDILLKLGITGVDAASPAALLANIQAVLDAMPRDKALDVSHLQQSVDIVSKISRLANGIGGDGVTADKFDAADFAAAGVSVEDAALAKAALSAIDAATFSQINSPRKLQKLVTAYANIRRKPMKAKPTSATDRNARTSTRVPTPPATTRLPRITRPSAPNCAASPPTRQHYPLKKKQPA
ncbi:hypothetical protein [Herbaspirillum sp. B65]|uniref:hypothetical protein n=1 Tax=Herbaspirillum sp. B65 TaxID=137708 RepID=UPI00034D39DD|nr:hypothetical protein [Herbaspirillum sp. B65]